MRNKRSPDYYQQIIHRILVQQYDRMNRQLDTVPLDGIDLDKDSRHSRIIKGVMAMEEEWIIDPKLRAQLSLIDLQPPQDLV
tara:strand:- start:1911 stop:2156 length:246 start_codon:yes stop_codon:yes gene_type:complete